MRTLVISLFGLVLLLALGPAKAADDLIGATLLVEMVTGTGTIDTGQTSLVISADGKVATTIGCNRMVGKATLDGTKLAFGPLMSTKKTCAPKLMEQEQIYANALAKVRSYTVDGPLTKFLDADGQVLIAFARAR